MWLYFLNEHGNIVQVDEIPDDVVIVDPAGWEYICQKDTQYAGGASREIYDTIGLNIFPIEVTNKINKKFEAAFHKYGRYNIIHVVGPDFREIGNVSYSSSMRFLSRACENVFR